MVNTDVELIHYNQHIYILSYVPIKCWHTHICDNWFMVRRVCLRCVYYVVFIVRGGVCSIYCCVMF